MAISPFRSFSPVQAQPADRSRLGLAGVGNTLQSPYAQSALIPGARGYWASSFGGAPRPGADEPAPVVTPEVISTPLENNAAPPALEDNSWETGRGGATVEGGGPDANGMEPAGEPGDMGDLGISFDGKTVGGLLGGAAGGLVAGPLGALAGSVGGRALGGMFDGGGGGSTGADSEAASATGGSANSAAAGFGGGYGTGLDGWGGLATGGRVGPQHLRKEIPMNSMNPRGLAGVGDMGAYAEGGPVRAPMPQRGNEQLHHFGGPRPSATAEVAANMPAPYDYQQGGYTAPTAGMSEADMMWLFSPATMMELQARNAAPQANSPSTGMAYQGAYAGGGPVGGMPHYMDGGEVDALAGPNPPGPDDGFAALDQGEFVVKQSQAQRPDYAPVLEQINQGTYEPDTDDGGGMSTEGQQIANGQTHGDPGALAPEMQMALQHAMAGDPMLAQALMQLLGPDAASSLFGDDMGNEDGMAQQQMDTGRPPMAGPPPIPGMHAPVGAVPPQSMMPPPQMPRQGLAGIGA